MNFAIASFMKSSSVRLHVIFVLNAVAVSLLWLYFVSHGFTANGIVDGVYEIQAAVLGQGRLSIVPGPLEVFYHDALLYWGQYYFYWGLLPSAILLGLTKLFGRLAAHYILVMGFLFMFVYFYQRMISRILACASQNDSAGGKLSLAVYSVFLTWLLIFIIPYPNDLGWYFGRFAVYEQQILFGLALAVPGLYFLISGLEHRRSGPIALAALFFVLASWTRVTWFVLALAMVPVAGVLIWKWRNTSESHSSPAWNVILLAASLTLILGLFLINYIRFDSPFDFGVRYQDPQSYVYFRTLKVMFFSPVAKFWNGLFNITSYFAPPSLVQQLGLVACSFSNYEGFPPSFFLFNPQFLPLAALLPLALYKTIKNRAPLAVWLVVVSTATLYLIVVLGFVGVFVILRYFMEFYYLLILCFLAVFLSLVRWRYALPIFILMLALHVPATLGEFRNRWPELRTADAGNALRVTSPQGRTPFLQRNAVWPKGTFSSADLPRTPRYAIIGLEPGPAATMLGRDIFALYLLPGNSAGNSSSAELEIKGLRSLEERGTVLVHIENKLLTSQTISTNQEIDLRLKVPFVLSTHGPYQVMVVFLPEGQSYLPCRTRGVPFVTLREVSLKHSARP